MNDVNQSPTGCPPADDGRQHLRAPAFSSANVASSERRVTFKRLSASIAMYFSATYKSKICPSYNNSVDFVDKYWNKARPIIALGFLLTIAEGVEWVSGKFHHPANLNPSVPQSEFDLLKQQNLAKDELIRAVSAKYDWQERAVAAFLEEIYREKVPADQVVPTLLRRVPVLKKAQEDLQSLNPNDPSVQQATKQAQDALATGDSKAADAKLDDAIAAALTAISQSDEVEKAAAKATEQRLATLAGLYNGKAQLAAAYMDFADSARDFDLAAETEPPTHQHERAVDLAHEAVELVAYANVDGDEQALARAMMVSHEALNNLSQSNDPVLWAVANDIEGEVITAGLNIHGVADEAALNRAVNIFRMSQRVLEPVRSRESEIWAVVQGRLSVALTELAIIRQSPAELASATQALLAAREDLRPFKFEHVYAWVFVNLQVANTELKSIEMNRMIPDEIPEQSVKEMVAALRDGLSVMPEADNGRRNRAMHGLIWSALGFAEIISGHLADADALEPSVRDNLDHAQVGYINGSVPVYEALSRNPFCFYLRPSQQSPFYPQALSSEAGTKEYSLALDAVRRAEAAFIEGKFIRPLEHEILGIVLVTAGYRLGDAQALRDGLAYLEDEKVEKLNQWSMFGYWVSGIAAAHRVRYEESLSELQASYDRSIGMSDVIRGDIKSDLALTKLQSAAFNDDSVVGVSAKADFDVALSHYGAWKNATNFLFPYQRVVQLNRDVALDFVQTVNNKR